MPSAALSISTNSGNSGDDQCRIQQRETVHFAPGKSAPMYQLYAVDPRHIQIGDSPAAARKMLPAELKLADEAKPPNHGALNDPVAQLSAQQQRRYSRNRHALLLAFQAMGAASIGSPVGPQGMK
jgi:hypothetical protein